MNFHKAIFLFSLVITAFITNYIYYDFFSSKYKRKYDLFYRIFYLFFSTSIIVFVNQYENVLLNYCVNIFLFIILERMFSKKSKMELIINFGFFVILALLDIICCFALILGMKIVNLQQYNDMSAKVFGMYLETLLFLMAYGFIKKCFIENNYRSLKKKDYLEYIYLSGFSWILCFGLAAFSFQDDNSLYLLFSFFVTIAMIIVNVIYLNVEETVNKKYILDNKINTIVKMNKSYCDRLEKKEYENDLILHDIKNHLQVLEKMIENNNNSHTIKQYFNKLTNTLEMQDQQFVSENKVLETIMNEKIKVAEENGISVNINYDNTNLLFLSEFDIVTIFANMFDNAIEALKENSDKKTINIIIQEIKSYVLIKMSNPCDLNKIIISNNKFKTTKENHSGLGIENINRTIEKYHGNCLIDTEDNIFKITVIFPF